MTESGEGEFNFDDMNFEDFLKNRDKDDDDETEELDQLLEAEGAVEEKDETGDTKTETLLDLGEKVEESPSSNEKPVKKERKNTKDHFILQFPKPKESEMKEIEKEDQQVEKQILLFVQGKLKKVVVEEKKSEENEEEAKVSKINEEYIATKLQSINKHLLDKYEGQVVPKPNVKELADHYKKYEKNPNFFEINQNVQNEIITLEFIHQHLNEKLYKFVMKSNRYRKQREMLKKMVREREMEMKKMKDKLKLIKQYEKRLKELDKDFVPGKIDGERKDNRASKILSFFGV